MSDQHYKFSCPFCSSTISDAVFLENKKFKAIYNIAPILPGHSLVIPINHISSIMELNNEDLAEFIIFSRKTVQILSSVFQTTAFNWTLQEKEEAGQTIEHLHIHIIPRTKGDLPEPGDWYPKLKAQSEENIDSDKRQKLKPEEMVRVVERLRKAVEENDKW